MATEPHAIRSSLKNADLNSHSLLPSVAILSELTRDLLVHLCVLLRFR